MVIYYNNNTLHEYNYNCYVVYKSSCKTYSFLDGAAGWVGGWVGEWKKGIIIINCIST